MSEDNQKDPKEDIETNSEAETTINSLTYGEVKKLIKAAEAGDKDAQRKLAESEGVQSFDEYKRTVEAANEGLRESLKPKYNSLKELNENLGKSAIAGLSKDWLNVEGYDEWRQSIAKLGQSILDATGVSQQMAELHNSLIENATGFVEVEIPSAVIQTQVSNIEELLEKSGAVTTTKSMLEELTKRQELFDMAEMTKNNLARMVEDSHITNMIATVEESKFRELADSMNQNIGKSMKIEIDGARTDLFTLQPEVFYVPPSSEVERIEEIRKSNDLQMQILHVLQELNENLKATKEKNSGLTSKSKTETINPTARTQVRGEVFKRLKTKHPEWSQAKVAMESSDELGEVVTVETVRNTYRQLGWMWERGDRIR